MASTPLEAVLLGLDALVDHGARLVELDVGRDGGADERDRRARGTTWWRRSGATAVLAATCVPVGMGQHGGDRVGDEDEREEEEDPLGVAVGAEEHERPDGDGGDRDREVARDAEELEGGGDAAELGDHEARRWRWRRP